MNDISFKPARSRFGKALALAVIAAGCLLISGIVPASAADAQLRDAGHPVREITWLQTGQTLGASQSLTPAQAAAIAASIQAGFTDTTGHWGAATIQWAVSRGIVDGYADRTFRPDQVVTVAEFLAMLLRAHADPAVEAAKAGEHWHEPYFRFADRMNWPISRQDAGTPYTRGQVAQLLAATQGQSLAVRDAVSYVLEHGLAEGKTGKTVEGFQPADTLTRAEAVQFIYNMGNTRLSAIERQASSRAFSVRGISLGDTAASVLEKLGEPVRKDGSEYGFEWYVYHNNYTNYAQIGIKDGKVTALYTNSSEWASSVDGLHTGSKASDVQRALGERLSSILKGNTRLILSASPSEEAMYETDKSYVTFYYDKHEQGKIDALFIIDKQVEDTKNGIYGKFNDDVQKAFERTLFDLANAARVQRGLKPYQWDDSIAGTARKHSADMMRNSYFGHDTPAGVTLADRLKTDRIGYSSASENIAAGQTNAFAAHAGWMNSEGHRKNVLGSTTRLGVGVSFGGNMHVYYTQNFYTPR